MTYPQPGQPPGAGKSKAPVIVGVLAIVVVVVATVLIALLVPGRGDVEGVASAGSSEPSTTKRATTSRKPTTSSGAPAGSGATKACEYKPASGGQSKNVGTPRDADKVAVTGAVRVTLKTSEGDIPMTLGREKAPCAVNSFLFLAEMKFYDGTKCHRLTTSDSLKVLQCGDPSGTGSGGPGYEYASENPKDLTPTSQGAVTYPAGTVAVANAGPDTNGSQFFLVYGASTIPPDYPVLGTFDASGKEVLDKVAAGGVADGGPDGGPKVPITIAQVSPTG
ncbi:hypothetical protein ALI144C_40980 [Actinosynnema sp. ALI-1.44]|uniref:peptidylprolyl isomerase n=1 Tax=Actinosynnema sp. ALI-1.44 TaxID=1933779 RepID=UPI00097C2011|nr:peptidylprolyl isomerase [Actinosynnema sp. ALI-1.44]ONI75126.1 hypothetical protein ALI144C_40980 [Actinosynnema sp. ALI-1.44]